MSTETTVQERCKYCDLPDEDCDSEQCMTMAYYDRDYDEENDDCPSCGHGPEDDHGYDCQWVSVRKYRIYGRS